MPGTGNAHGIGPCGVGLETIDGADAPLLAHAVAQKIPLLRVLSTFGVL